MSERTSRRQALMAMGASPFLGSVVAGAASRGLPAEGPQTPKLCMNSSAKMDEGAMRRVKQLGVDYLLMGGPRIPWDEAGIRAIMDRFKAGGLTVYNMMINGFPNAIYGRPGRDEDIERSGSLSVQQARQVCR